MNFEVVFSPSADGQVAQLWLRAADREKVMDAIDDLIRLLSESPEGRGESRGGLSDRLLYHSPFAVLFRIDEKRQMVRVTEVRWIGY